MPSLWSLILAAGSGTRLKTPDQPLSKQYLPYRGAPLFWQSALTLARFPSMQGLIFVFPPDDVDRLETKVARLFERDEPGVAWKAVAGGSSRRESSRLGLEALPLSCRQVLIHDAARPFVTPGVINRVVTALEGGCPAVVPGIPVKDTIRMIQDSGLGTLPREHLVAVQTPQGFERRMIQRAHARAAENNWDVTDDASLAEMMDLPVEVVEGDPANIKITTMEDLAMLRSFAPPAEIRTGFGYDVHRYGPGRPMRLGGVPITNGPEVVAHSDGDVLLHALIDALLGCMGLGDIGELFPDSDSAYENIASGVLLSEVLARGERLGLSLSHVDATLICQVPRLTYWKTQIRNNLASLLALPPDKVNVKATTEEGLGFTGEKKGIKAVALVTGTLSPHSTAIDDEEE